MSKKGQAWRRSNPAGYNAISKRYRLKLRQEIVNILGGRCECCLIDIIEFLAVDHRFGGGTQHRLNLGKGKMGSTAFYQQLRKAHQAGEDITVLYRLLCHNCNFAYGAYDICPHQNLS